MSPHQHQDLLSSDSDGPRTDAGQQQQGPASPCRSPVSRDQGKHPEAPATAPSLPKQHQYHPELRGEEQPQPSCARNRRRESCREQRPGKQEPLCSQEPCPEGTKLLPLKGRRGRERMPPIACSTICLGCQSHPWGRCPGRLPQPGWHGAPSPGPQEAPPRRAAPQPGRAGRCAAGAAGWHPAACGLTRQAPAFRGDTGDMG